MKGEINSVLLVIAIIALLIGGIAGYYFASTQSTQQKTETNYPEKTEAFKPSKTLIEEQFRYLEDLVEANTGQRPSFKTNNINFDEKNSLIIVDIVEETTSQPAKAYFTKDYKFIGFNAPADLKSLVAQLKQNKEGNTQNQPENQPKEVSADDDPYLGEDDAPVVIIEFSDFQCPFCKRFYDETEKQLIKDYVDTGKVKFVYRDFPLDSIHPYARKAAEAAECADEQGKFWEYHNLLFEIQKFDDNSLKSFAKELGLDTEQFNQCLDGGKYSQEVEKDLQDGISYGVTGTPTFFINGRAIVGAQPYSVLKQAIDQELQKTQNQ